MSGKKVRALMADEECVVPYAKKRRGYSSYKGEIGDAPGTSSRATSAPTPPTGSGSPT